MNKIGYLLLSTSLVTGLLAGCNGQAEEESVKENVSENVSESLAGESSTDENENRGVRPGDGGSGGGGFGMEKLDTSNIETKYTDISYADQSDTQKLDVYLPNEGEGPFPVIVAIHGGGFMMGSKTGGDVSSMLKGVENGYAVVSVDYRLSEEAAFPAAISDVKAAIRYIKANAEKYNLDPEKIAVWGDSAGGNLAALAGTSSDDEYLNGDNEENLEYSSEVQAVVDWFGPLEFLKMDEQFAEAGVSPKMGATSSDSSPESKYIGGNITENKEQTEKANPSNYISEDDPYFFIQHGTDDQNVPTQQSIDFAENLKAVLGEDKVTLSLLEGAGHGGEQFDAEENVQQVFEFLDSVLK